MFHLLILFIAAQQELHLKGIGRFIPVQMLQLGPQSEIFAVSNKLLIILSEDGELQRAIDVANPIVAYYVDAEFCYVATGKDSILAFDYRTGQLVASSVGEVPFIGYFLKSNKNTYAAIVKSREELDQQPFFLYVSSVVCKVNKDVLSVSAAPYFGKVTKKQAALYYNFGNMWIHEADSDYIIVNEVEARAYFFNSVSIRKEKSSGTKNPSEQTFKSLSLPKFVTPPDVFFGIKKPVHKDKIRGMYSSWWNSWSRITWFSKHKDGFVISYEIPDCNPDAPDQCPKTHLGVQRLDAQFQPRGDLIELDGKMIGVNTQGEIAVFVANPIIEDGKQAGYAPKVIFFD